MPTVSSTKGTTVGISDDTARDAYLYGYSMEKAYEFLYETTIDPGVRLNEFQKLRDLADDTYTAHPTINNDTLHLQGWFDVAAEPVVVRVPDVDGDRYWILHTMDMGHYTTAMIGYRTRGASGGTFLFAARDWAGEVPDGVDEVIRSDSNLIKVMGRIMTTGGADLEIARSLQDQWTLETLSEHGGTRAPAPVVRDFPDPAATTWLHRVDFLLADGSMARADAAWLVGLDAVGVEPGRTEFSDDQLDAAARGEALGMQHLTELVPTVSSSKGVLGTRDELQDAPRDVFDFGTLVGQWGLPAVESVYVKIESAAGSNEYINGSGGREFRASFPAPDVSEFWSVTVYGEDDRLMAHNSINRHSRGDRTLTPDENGMYSILLSADVDAHADDPEFLPIPEKDSYLILRLYGPSTAIQDGDFTPPVFTPVPAISTP
ncbi:hypothetical protein DEJ06_12785 [Curtobacterium sp. MCLR17_051]|nr:hypothetical protein DEJ07_12470 [Curtobacterium sp. MCLR17_053]PZF48550.1 hypothetical protein DEJ06_12785 [Curtobacterium sp. MCLR17_051]